MKLAMIVAQSKNRVIGRDNDLPWNLPNDLQYFKRVTMGRPVIMGRNTHESIGRSLPGRTNIVITSNVEYSAEGVKIVHSLEQAVELAQGVCLIDGVDEAMIIGGAQIYQQALSMADTLYITEVDAEIEGDAFFPALDYSLFTERARQDYASDDSNPYPYSFVVYDKIC
ncbi:dihydrofolate reductase ['Osedax' symbiont bacterium Rs2_46_30_T18]|nr:dihydrofolate reductase ['Osedax' symbiont bacterium Rs2_46_30_T18]